MKTSKLFPRPEYPLISIDGDGLMCLNGPTIDSHEFYCVTPTEDNAEVWLQLETERP